ncbi:YdcH family protein [Marinomonas balearica]|uniref:GTP-binding protein n=1 Tax=Marinomonas balearica TaxID=491947 RepID=A0A4V3CGT6_9GAMM|nr:DUF465 domain-containing protein [Marinomonas balearica]TDO98992.1 hypothetical protein DFP79_1416 [Marinomonas balearica]
MPIEKHSLVKELPEFKKEIHQLKLSDNHFKKLFDEYHYLDREIEQIEKEIVLAGTMEEEEFKKRRLLLKDTLFHYLQKAQHQHLAESA